METREQILRAIDISDALRKGIDVTVEGVRLNLGHPDLDLEVWKPRTGGRFDPQARSAPRLVVPWTTPVEIDRWPPRLDAVYLELGDQLVAKHVAIRPIESEFPELSHAKNGDIAELYVEIIKRDGSRQVVAAPILFVRKGHSSQYAAAQDYDELSRSLRQRLTEAFDLDFDEPLSNFVRKDRNERARVSVELRYALLAALEMDGDCNPASVAFGYHMALAELEPTAVALARERLERRYDRSRSAKVLAEENSRRADDIWRARFLDECCKQRLKNPNVGQKALVKLIADQAWYVALGADAPELDTMRRTVSSFEREGLLTRSLRNHRKGVE